MRLKLLSEDEKLQRALLQIYGKGYEDSRSRLALPLAYKEPGARAYGAENSGASGIPSKPRHRQFLGVNPSA